MNFVKVLSKAFANERCIVNVDVAEGSPEYCTFIGNGEDIAMQLDAHLPGAVFSVLDLSFCPGDEILVFTLEAEYPEDADEDPC